MLIQKHQKITIVQIPHSETISRREPVIMSFPRSVKDSVPTDGTKHRFSQKAYETKPSMHQLFQIICTSLTMAYRMTIEIIWASLLKPDLET